MSKYCAQKKYDKENTVTITIKLNKKTDKKIIELLNKTQNKQGTIKNILNQYIEKR